MPRWPATKTRWPFSSNGVLAIGHLAPGDCEIAGHHLLDEFGDVRLRFPAELLVRLAGVADQKIDLGGAEILGIDRTSVLPDFLSTPVSSTPLPRHSMLRPTSASASSTNSRTERVSPVASTKSSGWSACRIWCMPST